MFNNLLQKQKLLVNSTKLLVICQSSLSKLIQTISKSVNHFLLNSFKPSAICQQSLDKTIKTISNLSIIPRWTHPNHQQYVNHSLVDSLKPSAIFLSSLHLSKLIKVISNLSIIPCWTHPNHQQSVKLIKTISNLAIITLIGKHIQNHQLSVYHSLINSTKPSAIWQSSLILVNSPKTISYLLIIPCLTQQNHQQSGNHYLIW